MKMIHIPYTVPSSKNGRQLTKGGIFIASKATQIYRKKTSGYWKHYKNEFLAMCKDKPRPLMIGFHFVRQTRHAWDFPNPLQTIFDEMTKHGWLPDDNVHEIFPVPLLINDRYWSLNKKHAGVYIAVLDNTCQTNIELKDLTHDGSTKVRVRTTDSGPKRKTTKGK